MTFGSPQLLWLLAAAPLAALLLVLLWRRRLAATRQWASRSLWSRLAVRTSESRLWTITALFLLALAAGVFALAEPRWGETTRLVERTGVDVVFVVDSSMSMAATDVQPDRIGVAKTLTRRLAQQLPGNRVALIQSEGEGVVLCPLTIDAAVIDLLLETVAPGTLPQPGTRIVPALEKALELFPEGTQKHRVIVLISDGEDHEGGFDTFIPHLTDAGVTVHTLGVGTESGSPIPLGEGSDVEYKTDEDGRVVISRLEAKTLTDLAGATGGTHLHAGDLGTSIERIADEIRAMEKRKLGGETLTTREERFQWPTGAALLALVAHLLISPFRPGKEIEL